MMGIQARIERRAESNGTCSIFFFSSRRRHTRYWRDWSSDVCSSDLVLVLTEWRQYRELDPVAFSRVVAQRRVLDGRNALDREAWTAAGWTYRALGRRAKIGRASCRERV